MRVQRNAVVEDKALAFPLALCVRQGLKVIQYAAVEFIDIETQTVHPGARFFTANATGAIHRNPLSCCFPGGSLRPDEVRKVTKILNVGVQRRLESTQSKLERVAVVKHHHIVLRHQLSPGLRAHPRPNGAVNDISGISRRVNRHANRHNFAFAVHLHARKRRCRAVTSLEHNASEAAVAQQRSLENIQLMG